MAQAEHGSLPRPGVSADGDKLLQLVHKLAAAKGGDVKVEVDEALVRKFASGEGGWWQGVLVCTHHLLLHSMHEHCPRYCRKGMTCWCCLCRTV